MKKIALYVSSLTGNTQKIADALYDNLNTQGYDVIMQDSCLMNRDIIDADYHIVCFWCRRAGLDDDSQALIDRYKDTSFLAVGTCGHYPDSPYSDRIRKNVADYINQYNSCIDIFLSQGAVSMAKAIARRNLPESSPHHLDDEGFARHLESQNHPNENDIEAAIGFVNAHLAA